MKKVFIIIFFAGGYYGIKHFTPQAHTPIAEPTIVTGIVLITAYLFGLLLKTAKLPKLTGYMLFGLAIGPIGLNILTESLLDQLHFLEDLALSFIAITAGGEFKFQRIRKLLKSAIFQLSGQMVFVFVGIAGILIFFAPQLPFMDQLQSNLVKGFAILFAGTALSKSPATTIGIITELRSHGRITDMVLSITVLKAITLVAIFPLLIAWAKIYLIPGTTLNMELLISVAVQIFGSIFLGIAIGFGIILYLKYIDFEQPLFLLATAIVLVEFTIILHLEILLTSLVAGIIVENFSKKGEALIFNIEKSSLPFYILFFGLAGAGLHIEALKEALGLTALLVLVRLLLLYFGNYAGAFIAGETKLVKHVSWIGYIGQAGIAVGLGNIIENTFPGTLGSSFKTILIATVVINELLGPIFLKYLLMRAGENTQEG